MLIIVLAIVALILAIIELSRSQFQSLLAWAVVLLAAIVVIPELVSL